MHFFIHIINNSAILLRVFGPVRHHFGLRRITRLPANIDLLIVGESHVFPNAYTTNYQVFTKRFLDATKLEQIGRRFRYLYADNVVEHLPLQSVRKMLTSAFHILEDGGTIRLCTPDAGELVNLYINRDPIFLDLMRNDLLPHSVSIEYPVDILRQGFSEFGHHKGFVFDRASIQTELENVGFSNVTFFKVSHSSSERLCNLEQRVGGSHDFTQMCVEATKAQSD